METGRYAAVIRKMCRGGEVGGQQEQVAPWLDMSCGRWWGHHTPHTSARRHGHLTPRSNNQPILLNSSTPLLSFANVLHISFN